MSKKLKIYLKNDKDKMVVLSSLYMNYMWINKIRWTVTLSTIFFLRANAMTIVNMKKCESEKEKI